MTVPDILDVINQAGTVGLLVIIIVGGMRGWYVWKREHEEVVKDRDFWRITALQGIQAAEKSLDIQRGSKT